MLNKIDHLLNQPAEPQSADVGPGSFHNSELTQRRGVRESEQKNAREHLFRVRRRLCGIEKSKGAGGTSTQNEMPAAAGAKGDLLIRKPHQSRTARKKKNRTRKKGDITARVITFAQERERENDHLSGAAL